MTACVPGTLDRPTGEERPPAGRPGPERREDAVARDREALLNTGVDAAVVDGDGHPPVRASIPGDGPADGAGSRLSGSDDRAAVCASPKNGIERLEPRLAGVDRRQVAIHARRRAGAHAGPIDFNAVPQPSTPHDASSRAGRTGRSA